MQEVVGAAVVRHGQVLAARRTTPAEAAGRWEFAGGKVEPGESAAQALAREVAEELGCEVAIDRWLEGAAPVRAGLVLRVALCTLRSGEPTPVEHDRVSWVGPEQLGDLDWLDPDRPFLAELREVLLDGERLPGGNVGGAVRIGDTVRRPTGPWTPSVHRLLQRLDAAGVPHVPRLHGIDERGREVLDHLPGEVVDVDRDLLSEARLVEVGRWARRLHDALDGHPLDGTWRFFGAEAPSTIAHNDLAPYNLAFDGERLSGVFDWDLAGPSTPLLELAHVAWTAVPLFRPVSEAQAARRLRLLATAYAGPSAVAILDAVPERLRIAIDGIRAAAAGGDQGMRRLMATGEPSRTEERLAAFLERLPRIRAELAYPRPVRCIFFDEDDARAAAARLLTDGWDAAVDRERLAGEDDDEDHPWAVLSDAPAFVLELLVDRLDGWLDLGDQQLPERPPPLDLPAAPRRIKRPPV